MQATVLIICLSKKSTDFGRFKWSQLSLYLADKLLIHLYSIDFQYNYADGHFHIRFCMFRCFYCKNFPQDVYYTQMFQGSRCIVNMMPLADDGCSWLFTVTLMCWHCTPDRCIWCAIDNLTSNIPWHSVLHHKSIQCSSNNVCDALDCYRINVLSESIQWHSTRVWQWRSLQLARMNSCSLALILAIVCNCVATI